MKQKAKLDFSGQKVYVGIDVHLKSWKIAIELENISQKPFSQKPDTQKLYEHLVKNYPNAEYHCVYEAGFSGYWLKDQLEELGVNCIVVNPADVPTSDKEKRQKSDRLDSLKLVKGLKNGSLIGIHVPDKTRRAHRSITRNRERISRDRRRIRNRIRSHFNFYGLTIPDGADQYWSKKIIEEFKTMSINNEDITLQLLIEQYLALQQLEQNVKSQIRILSKTELYKLKVELLTSIPGIGLLTAMLILTEIGDIRRFKRLDQLCAYVGLIPNTHSSGEKIRVGSMTHRGNTQLKTALIESAWMAVFKDPALGMKYEAWKKEKGKAQLVIVKIARKLLNRIRYVLLNEQPYELGIVC